GVAVVQVGGPDERVAPLISLFVSRRLGKRRRVELEIGEAADDHFAQHPRLLVRRAIEPRFVGEFQSDAVFADPADRAFDSTVFAEAQLDLVPEQRLEATDHRSAAREIDQLKLVLLALMSEADLLIEQPVAVAVAAVGPPL